jgi:hypothetical protein
MPRLRTKPTLRLVAVVGALLGAAPATAQPVDRFEPINFVLRDAAPDCPSGNVCHFYFSLPQGADLRQVACQNFLLDGAATEIATLETYPGSAISKRIPLTPVKVTGNGFVVSQRIFLPDYSLRVTIQSFGAAIVAGAYCSIAGITVGQSYFSPPPPFSRADEAAECTADRKLCTFEFGPVAASRRWTLQQVACRNNLLSSTATELVTLSIVDAGDQTTASFPLIPEKLTGNGFTVSQRIAIPIRAGNRARIRVQSFGAGIAAFPTCTLSGYDVELVPE